MGQTVTGIQIADSSVSPLDLVADIAISGTDTYTGTVAPTPVNQAALLGKPILCKFTNANTGAATLNLNGFGAQAIKKAGTTALVSGDIAATQEMWIVWDGTNYQIASGSGGSGTATTQPYNSNDTAVATDAYADRAAAGGWSDEPTVDETVQINCERVMYGPIIIDSGRRLTIKSGGRLSLLPAAANQGVSNPLPSNWAATTQAIYDGTTLVATDAYADRAAFAGFPTTLPVSLTIQANCCWTVVGPVTVPSGLRLTIGSGGRLNEVA